GPGSDGCRVSRPSGVQAFDNGRLAVLGVHAGIAALTLGDSLVGSAFAVKSRRIGLSSLATAANSHCLESGDLLPVVICASSLCARALAFSNDEGIAVFQVPASQKAVASTSVSRTIVGNRKSIKFRRCTTKDSM